MPVEDDILHLLGNVLEPPEPYIPEDLEGCFIELKRQLSQESIGMIKSWPEGEVITLHHSLGQHLRNLWGLWTSSDLQKFFVSKGLHHADDMSGVILTSFWRHLNDLPLKVEEQVKQYQDFWEARKGESDSGPSASL